MLIAVLVQTVTLLHVRSIFIFKADKISISGEEQQHSAIM